MCLIKVNYTEILQSHPALGTARRLISSNSAWDGGPTVVALLRRTPTEVKGHHLLVFEWDL